MSFSKRAAEAADDEVVSEYPSKQGGYMVQPKGDKANFIQWWDEDPGWRRCVGFITVPNIGDKIYNGTEAIPPTLKVGSF